MLVQLQVILQCKIINQYFTPSFLCVVWEVVVREKIVETTHETKVDYILLRIKQKSIRLGRVAP